MDKIIGFVGYGNMGYAMVNSIIREKLVPIENIIVSKETITEKDMLRNKDNIKLTTDNIEVAKNADILVLAIKPNVFGTVLKQIKNSIKKDAIVISIAAGINLSYIKGNFGESIKIVRAMPNTPALVGQGMTGYALGSKLTVEELNNVEQIFNSFGRSQLVDENLLDGVTGIAGSSPAYVYMMIEALADGGVREGIPRSQAYTFAAQAVLGSAKMVLETSCNPAELKDNVCSPGGTTIEAVASLEKNGFRSALIEAVKVCAEKSRELGK
ncbi:MAG: pyrroline-5-carboxylate reductase [Tissierellia bacterium]|nr:pyrroline-5-carboxylate reductase [Tissierellia bacterium]MDD4725992.1 pyrroline-5-carboxylate reductase [Tissierellia bacterium]